MVIKVKLKKIIAGGLMMGGKTVFTADIPVVKGTSGIVVLAHTAGTVKRN